jgi:hypothetical protein
MWWQAAINRPSSAILFIWRIPFRAQDTVFHFSDFGMSLLPQCCIESLLFFPVSISQSVWVVAWWVDHIRSQGSWGPAKYLNWLLTLIVTKQDCQEMSVQLREVLKVCQGYHSLVYTAKQLVVMCPAVQFCPVPPMKMMLVWVGQVNRLNSQ